MKNFVLDLTRESFKTEKELQERTEYYPDRTILLVTGGQKALLNEILHAEETRYEVIGKSDALTWDNPITDTAFYIMTARNFERVKDQ